MKTEYVMRKYDEKILKKCKELEMIEMIAQEAEKQFEFEEAIINSNLLCTGPTQTLLQEEIF